jgi:hypothetical protein
VQDDDTQPRRSASSEGDHQFELPHSVREVRPEPGHPPAQAAAGSTSPAPLAEPPLAEPPLAEPTPAEEPAPAAELEAGGGERPLASEMSAAFQRRWEDVQTLFLARSGRGRLTTGR